MRTLNNTAMLFHTIHQTQQQDGLLATMHDIVLVGNEPTLAEGKLLTQDDVTTLFAYLCNLKPSSALQYLPQTILASNKDALVWHVPARTRPMLFQIGKQRRRLQVPWPHLVFNVKNKSLRVAAVRTAKRPDASTVLYHAPLMNIFQDTKVCTGNAELPDDISIDQRSAWESVIFDTYFTHVNHERTLHSAHRDHYAFWKSLDKQPHFPKQSLVSLRTTLEEWINV